MPQKPTFVWKPARPHRVPAKARPAQLTDYFGDEVATAYSFTDGSGYIELTHGERIDLGREDLQMRFELHGKLDVPGTAFYSAIQAGFNVSNLNISTPHGTFTANRDSLFGKTRTIAQVTESETIALAQARFRRGRLEVTPIAEDATFYLSQEDLAFITYACLVLDGGGTQVRI